MCLIYLFQYQYYFFNKVICLNNGLDSASKHEFIKKSIRWYNAFFVIQGPPNLWQRTFRPGSQIKTKKIEHLLQQLIAK